MAFPSADHIARQDGTFEPQLSNRWALEVHGLNSGDSDLIILSLQNFTPPTITLSDVELPYGNEVRKVAGQATFDNISLTVKDFVDVPVRDALHRWFEKVYDPKTGKFGYAKDYKKKGTIVMTGPDGESERFYEVEGMYISSLNPGSFDMAGADNVQIEVTISVDKAIQIKSA